MEKTRKLLQVAQMKTEELNKLISKAEEKAKNDIKRIEQLASKYENISIKIDDTYTTAKYIQAETGLYITPGYNNELERFTACLSDNQRHLLYYAIRDNIYMYYTFVNAQIKKDRIILKGDRIYNTFLKKYETIKEYQNGRVDIKLNNELIEEIENVKKIESIFNKNYKD